MAFLSLCAERERESGVYLALYYFLLTPFFPILLLLLLMMCLSFFHRFEQQQQQTTETTESLRIWMYAPSTRTPIIDNHRNFQCVLHFVLFLNETAYFRKLIRWLLSCCFQNSKTLFCLPCSLFRRCEAMNGKTIQSAKDKEENVHTNKHKAWIFELKNVLKIVRIHVCAIAECAVVCRSVSQLSSCTAVGFIAISVVVCVSTRFYSVLFHHVSIKSTAWLIVPFLLLLFHSPFVFYSVFVCVFLNALAL